MCNITLPRRRGSRPDGARFIMSENIILLFVVRQNVCDTLTLAFFIYQHVLPPVVYPGVGLGGPRPDQLEIMTKIISK